MRIVLTGNPNSGKTTLFNALTGSNERVGNWHGVTVSVLKGKVKLSGKLHEVYDLPGLTSLNGYTLEEKSAAEFLKKGDYDLIINVIEASRFSVALNLTEELFALRKPIICLVNMSEDLERLGGNINYNILADSGLVFKKTDLRYKSRVKKIFERCLVEDFTKVNGEPNKFDRVMALKAFKSPKNIFTKTDKILTNAAFSTLIFAIAIAVSFYLSFGKFGIGKILSDLLITTVVKAGDIVENILRQNNANDFTARLIVEGVIGGVGSLLGFLPPLFLLNFFLCYLEQSGLIARISFVFDGFLSKFGLNGRALFALITGFGCTTISILMTRGLENERVKHRLILGLPFISCSAKFVVYLYIASCYGSVFAFLLTVSIYLFGFILALAVSFMDVKLLNENYSPFIMELPILRLKCLKNTVKPLLNSVKQFIIKVSTIILAVSIVTFLLGSINFKFEYLPSNRIDESILSFFGQGVSLILKPIGVNDYKIGSALISGLFAKEAFISTLASLNYDYSLTIESAIAILSFVAFYPPCLTALGAIRREAGVFQAVYCFLFQTAFALLFSYLVYFLCKRLTVLLLFIFLTALFIFAVKVGNKNEKFHCKGKN